MLCNVCQKKEAVVHYAEIVNGQMKKMDLCESCAVEKGVGTSVSINMTDLLTEATESTASKEAQPKEVCPSCKMTFLDFKKSGRLGCSQCYQAFKKSLAPLIETIHHHSRHVGKSPIGKKKDMVKMEKLHKLQEDLAEAIAQEEFELAASIRDRIREMENKK